MPILILVYRSIFLIGYIVYVALLLRMTNDVEENPEPTVFDIIYPSETICQILVKAYYLLLITFILPFAVALTLA